MSNTKATPTPWFTRGDESVYGPDGVIARTNIGVGGIKRNVANAAYIANAVNSYDVLKASNQELLAMLKHLVSLDEDDVDNLDMLKESAKEIIAKGEDSQTRRGK